MRSGHRGGQGLQKHRGRKRGLDSIFIGSDISFSELWIADCASLSGTKNLKYLLLPREQDML